MFVVVSSYQAKAKARPVLVSVNGDDESSEAKPLGEARRPCLPSNLSFWNLVEVCVLTVRVKKKKKKKKKKEEPKREKNE